MSPVIHSAHAARKLGRLPAKSDPRALMFSRFATAKRHLPKTTNFWRGRHPFPQRTFGNNDYLDCTRAAQASGALRMERLETRQTPHLTDEEVVRVYLEMIQRLYRGREEKAYLMDALDCWRRPEETFCDTAGRPLTIDAYVKVHPSDQLELRAAIEVAAAHGIIVGLDLPAAFAPVVPPAPWDVPAGEPMIGAYEPGSWGGHAMWARDYDEDGVWLVHTWGLPDQLLTWRAAAAYMQEAYVVIDSVDAWRRRRRGLDVEGIRRAVNRISSHKLYG
jgi:hypothetical protein